MSTTTGSLAESTLEGLLEALASKQPVPGGGAVAGITTALAAGLGGMVVAYSLGKPALETAQPMLEETAHELETLRRRALEEAEGDAAAYGRLNALWSLEKEHPDRVSGWNQAVEGAIEAPGAIMRTADRVLELLERLPGNSARHLASDLSIAVELAATGARSGERNVAVNLPLLEDETARERFDETYGELGARVDARARSILEQIA
ncbi:MAG: cyclodeaminase/cyclohydrolase family protein [Phycisphaerales bacterium]|nr:cyclodeaminase/cyclohydrolase family protein [Phycisphaerales bacterium]